MDLSVVTADAETVRPAQAIRGLQPPTLHPIESMFDLGVPSADDLEGYDYGYLLRADQLGYWERELDQLRALTGQSVIIPGCALQGRSGTGPIGAASDPLSPGPSAVGGAAA